MTFVSYHLVRNFIKDLLPVTSRKSLPFRCCIIKVMAKTVNGRERSWQIGKPLGSGDAGEVLQAISLPAISRAWWNVPCKAPGGTIVRQAGKSRPKAKSSKPSRGELHQKRIDHPYANAARPKPEGTSQTVNPLWLVRRFAASRFQVCWQSGSATERQSPEHPA